MSVNKYRIRKGDTYTTVLNSVINTLKNDLVALGLYTYLLSLPADWEFHKSHLRAACNIGQNKLDQLFTRLTKQGLMQIIPIRNEKGQFVYFDLLVLDGTTSSTMKTIPMETIPMENRSYKENNIQNKKRTKKLSCSKSENEAPSGESGNPLDEKRKGFAHFRSIYPRQQGNWPEAERKWLKIDQSQYKEIFDHVEKRKKVDAQWQNKKFIPLCTTFLNGQRWKDEILTDRTASEPKLNEVKSTVPWFDKKARDERWEAERNRITTDGNNDANYDSKPGNNAWCGNLPENKSFEISKPSLDRGERQDCARSDGVKKAGLFILPTR